MTECVVSGWGTAIELGNEASTILKYEDVELYTRKKCKKFTRKQADTAVCAGEH